MCLDVKIFVFSYLQDAKRRLKLEKKKDLEERFTEKKDNYFPKAKRNIIYNNSPNVNRYSCHIYLLYLQRGEMFVCVRTIDRKNILCAFVFYDESDVYLMSIF